MQSLKKAVEYIERAKSQLRNDNPDAALELWHGLISGRWSLISRWDSDGRRLVLAVRNDPKFADPRQLTLRERQCARLAGLGQSNMEIAYSLGISEHTAGWNVGRAVRKLSLTRRSDLAMAVFPEALDDISSIDVTEHLRAVSFRNEPRMPEGLTAAERSIAALIIDGASNEDIAAKRGTAPRTVANQVRSLFIKCGVHSRAELVARLVAPGALDPQN